MTAPVPDPTVEVWIDELAGVLDTHEWSESEDFCNCGHYVGARMPSVHKWHLATLLAEHTERAVREALEAAADDFTADCTRACTECDEAAKWLRERARLIGGRP